MPLYTFHDLILRTEQEEQCGGEDLDRLLAGLSWVRILPRPAKPDLCLSICSRSNGLRAPPAARELFRADGLCAQQNGDNLYLTDGVLALAPATRARTRKRFHRPVIFYQTARSCKITSGRLVCSNFFGPWDSIASTPRESFRAKARAFSS